MKIVTLYIFFSSLLLLSTSTLFASTARITGTITLDGELAIGANIGIKSLDSFTATDVDGQFVLDNVPFGTYELQVSYIGATTLVQELIVQQKEITLQLQLQKDAQVLAEATVTAKSQAREQQERPIQIASIDIVKLQSESADIVAVLDRTAGVRVRQSGGLGSNTTIQLNGLTGRAVRTYYDGIPLELYGGSIQLNNLPVNAIERVDVYKGVMPVDVGTDALAGGINVLSRQVDYDYLDVSYQLGSFNTHVAALNTSKKLGNHLIASLSSFYNYSDNSYDIRARQRTPDFKEIEVEVPRFHSVHQSSMVSGLLSVVDVKWADKLSYGISYNQRYDEIQHGVRIGNKAVGEANVRRNAIVQNLKYQKGLLNDRLVFNYFGNYSVANENIQDSTLNVYNWFGEIVATNQQGMEVLALPSLREGVTRSQAHRLNATYTIAPAHVIKVSSFLSDQNVEGEDPIAPKIGGVDPNTIPSFLTRSISGISYEADWFNERLESVLFGKYYYYKQSTTDFRSSNADQAFEFSQEDSATGYGLGLKYTFKEDFFLRTSYEEAIRIPTKDEVFGNFLTIEPNFSLRPEESKNLNVGLYYKHRFNDNQYVALDANWFIRDQSNLIRLEPGRNENDPAQFINEAEADATGVELTLRTAPIKSLELAFNYTNQEVVKDGDVNATNTNGIGTAIPNIPSTFYNASIRYRFSNPLAKADQISVFSYYTYVSEFDLIFQATRNEANIIPAQRQLDIGLTYNMANKGLTFSLQTNNILDEEVFDNYRVPKPGRNFSFKVRYLLQKV